MTEIKNIIKKRMDLHDVQKILARNGELCNDDMVMTPMENKLGQALVENNIKIIPNFMLENKSFDFKLFHYPVLIECDGGYHKEEKSRLRDYRKDRIAQKRGFKVLRFTNFEIHNDTHSCVQQINAIIKRIKQQPREIWLCQYTLIDLIKDRIKKWKEKK